MHWKQSILWSRVFAVTAALCLVAPLAAENTDWAQFRGPDRDGISSETGLATTWPEDGPQEVWRVEIGEGFSAISVVGDRLYTMYAEAAPEAPADEAEESADTAEGDEAAAEAEAPSAGREYAAAFDATTGKEIWRTDVGEKLDNQFGNGPRATPTVDGDRLFVLSSFGTLYALATADGKELWKVDFTSEDFGSSRPYFGYSTSALVQGDLLMVEVGGTEGKSYAGLDKTSGEVLWTSGDGASGYSSALRVEMHGQEQFVYVTGGFLRAVDKDGNELWSYEWPQGETHSMPIVIEPDMIFASGAEGVGATVVKVTSGDDGLGVEEVWKSNRFKNHFSSSVLHGGHLYGFDNATLKAIDAMTGEQAWAKRGLGKGSLILADGHLLVLSDRGVLVSIEATPEAYTEKSRVQAIDGKSWTAPSLAHGKLYLRNHNEMVCYDLKG